MAYNTANNRLCFRLLLIPLLLHGIHSKTFAQEYLVLRERMVSEQLQRQGIKSQRVLNAMRKVERHLFVPTAMVDRAYDDNALSIGEGQTISQPYVVAFMTEALQLKPEEKVLEIGTGSGYQAAILAELCNEVYTMEINERLAKNAQALLKSLGYQSIHVRQGDGYLGWQEAAPFDAIIVTCSPSHIPKPLQDQLKEGGRMIIPVGPPHSQELIFMTKKNGKLKKEKRLSVLFVPMKDEKGKRY